MPAAALVASPAPAAPAALAAHRPATARRARPAVAGPTRLLLVLAVLLGTLLPAQMAAAQRVRDVFPQPLAGRDLDEIGRRLGMSDFQRLALDPAHVRYLDGYRELRERELEPFLGDLLAQGRTFFFNPDPDLAREFLRRLERAERRIESLDEELFAAMDQVLAGGQRDRMPEVRMRRQLDRLNSGFIRGLGAAIPATVTDYGRILERADLSAAERERIEPLIFEYENRVANARRRVREQGERVIIELVEEAARLFQQVLAGGEIGPEAANVWESLRRTAYEKLKPVAKDVVALARINRDMLAQWSPLLPDRVAEHLRTIHYQYGYQEALTPFIRARDQHDRALRLPGLPPETRQQVESMRADLSSRVFRLAARLESDAFELAESVEFLLVDDEDDLEGVQEIEERYEEMQRISRESVEALEAVLGAERFALLDRPEDEGGPAPAGDDPVMELLRAPPARLLARQPEVASLDVPDPELDPAAPFVAGPITERELDWFAGILELGDVQREMLAAIRIDHLDRFEAFRAEQADRARRMVRAATNQGQRDEGEPEQAEALASLPVAWEEADAALAELDASFFADLELIVLDPADPSEAARMPAVRQVRERVRLSAGAGRGIGGWAGRMVRPDDDAGLEHAIDLDLLLIDLGPAAGMASADGAGDAASVLQTYARDRTDAMRRHLEAARGLVRVLGEMAAAPEEDRRDGSYWQRMREPRQALTSARRDLVRINRRALDRLERAMPDGAAAALRDRYQRTAFPDVYEDEQAAEGPLMAALDLPDLGPDQRDRIGELVAMYRPRYQELCSAMVEEQMAQATGRGGRRAWQERTARANRIEQHVFDREELNARTLRALRSVLDERQAMDVGFAPAAG